MTTIALIIECLSALKDRTGSSLIAINKWILAEKKVRGYLSWGVFYGIVYDEREFSVGEFFAETKSAVFKSHLLETYNMSYYITNSILPIVHCNWTKPTLTSIKDEGLFLYYQRIRNSTYSTFDVHVKIFVFD